MGNYLSYDQISSILPEGFTPVKKLQRNLYKLENGSLMLFVSSKLYKGDIYWYSIFVDNISAEGVEYICFCTGFSGVIIVPIQIIKEYAKYADYKQYDEGNRHYIRMRNIHSQYFLYHSKKKDINITQYYFPYC